MLKISCWNSDWATLSSKRGEFFIDKFDSDIICLTKGFEILLPQDGYIISLNEDYGYTIKNGRRKVILWSKNKWTELNQIGSNDVLPNFFIFKSSEVSNCIKDTLKEYMNSSKKDGGQRIDKGIRHFEPSEKFKEERKDNWDIMFQQT